ncbi:MAG: RsmB/NOP family class I SAM-dependent RNA methyltransferase [Minwuia sp.]|nr:RsmB/NOP family class I SAM-dependent RNA methyltransferase [Minwuia sp.]
MTPTARLQAAIDLLDRIETEAPAADWIMRDYFRRRRYAGSGDRRAVGQAVFSVLRQRGILDWRLQRAGLPADNRLRLFLSTVMAADGHPLPQSDAPHGPVPVTAPEAEALSVATACDPADAPLPSRTSFPDHILDDLTATFGDDLGQAMQAQMQDVAAVDIRVNAQVTDRETVLARLKVDGIDAEPFGWTDCSIRLAGRPNLNDHPLMTEGKIEIQDAGSQLVAALVSVAPGEQVVDFCAGAGGKALAMGAQMANKGELHALDVDVRRLERLRTRATRAGVRNIQTRRIEPSGDLPEQLVGRMDRVLVDAPCSGSGTWRRQPEQRWRLDEARLAQHQARQIEIAERAASLLRPGGLLVYVTCSILRVENEMVITELLRRVPHLARVDCRDIAQQCGLDLPEGSVNAAGELRLSPHCHEVDGFFAAALRRDIS